MLPGDGRPHERGRSQALTPLTFEAFALPAGTEHGEPRPVRVRAGDRHAPELEYTVPTWSEAAARGLLDDLAGAGAALAERSSADIAESLGRVGERFGDAHDEVRLQALELLPPTAALSPQMARELLDAMARDWSRGQLARLLEHEFGDVSCLEQLVSAGGRGAMAIGPRLCLQVVSGSVPGVGVNALIRSLLVKGPTLLKPGVGDTVLPVLFARALREEDADLADALAVVYWTGGAGEEIERVALEEADVVVVYGSDETVSALRARTAPTARFVGYHHRVSVGIVGRAALGANVSVGGPANVARDVAMSVAIFDQRGCVCPQIVYVEEGGELTPHDFAERLAAAFAEIERRLPGGPLEAEESAALQQFRGNAELHAATGSGQVYHGGAQASWTVVYESAAVPGPTCLARSIRVRPIRDAEELSGQLAPLQSHLQTIGVAGLADRLGEVAPAWGRLGASRIVPFSRVPFPPPWWLHDGRGPLRELIRWVEVEE